MSADEAGKNLNCPLFYYLSENRDEGTSLADATKRIWEVPGGGGHDGWLVDGNVDRLSSTLLYLDFVAWTELLYSQSCYSWHLGGCSLTRPQIMRQLITRDLFLKGPYDSPLENYVHHMTAHNFTQLNEDTAELCHQLCFSDEDDNIR